ncbi:hypothetical protein ACX12E_30810 [Paenibacillus vandeheii]
MLPLERLAAYLVSGRWRAKPEARPAGRLVGLAAGYHAEGKREKKMLPIQKNRHKPVLSFLPSNQLTDSTMMKRSGIMVLPLCMAA